jgi:hypothetical protein
MLSPQTSLEATSAARLALRWCRLGMVAVILLQASFCVTALIDRPKLSSDATAGMAVWESMGRGSGWNRYLEPDPSNIATDRSEFLTWWSPGQYLAVGPLKRLGLSWGAAIACATLLFSILGILGFLRLYAEFGFGPVTCAVATAVVSLTWHVTSEYGQYLGGELPLFGVTPWLLIAIYRLRPLRWWSAFPFAAIYVAGAMMKLSFCVVALAALAGLCCVEFFGTPGTPGARGRLGIAGKAVVMAVAAHAALWTVFLRLGANPSGIGAHGNPWWFVVPVAIVEPVLGVGGIGTMLGRVFMYPGHYIVSATQSLAPIYWVLAGGAAWFYWRVLRSGLLGKGYRCFVGGVALAHSAILGTLIVAGAAISVEDRHFFFAGALLVPAVVEIAARGPGAPLRATARASLAVAVVYGAVAMAVHAHQVAVTANVGRGGFTQHVISREALAALHRLDDAAFEGKAASLVYVPSPEISFEVRGMRVMSTSDMFTPADILRGRVMHGRVPLLVVLTSSTLEADGRGDIVRRSFVDYPPSDWKQLRVGDWDFYYQGSWPGVALGGLNSRPMRPAMSM